MLIRDQHKCPNCGTTCTAMGQLYVQNKLRDPIPSVVIHSGCLDCGIRSSIWCTPDAYAELLILLDESRRSVATESISCFTSLRNRKRSWGTASRSTRNAHRSLLEVATVSFPFLSGRDDPQGNQCDPASIDIKLGDAIRESAMNHLYIRDLWSWVIRAHSRYSPLRSTWTWYVLPGDIPAAWDSFCKNPHIN